MRFGRTVAALTTFMLPTFSPGAEPYVDDRLAAAATAYLAETKCPGGISLDFTAMPDFGDQADRYMMGAVKQYNDSDLRAFCAAASKEASLYGLIARTPEQDPEAFALGSMMALLFICPDFALDAEKLIKRIDEKEAAEKGFKDRVNSFAVSVGSRTVDWKEQKPALLRQTCSDMEKVAAAEGIGR